MIKKFFILFLFVFLFCLNSVFAKENIEVINKTAGVWIFKINTKKIDEKIKPYVAKKITTPRNVYNDNSFELVVNGGFFDVKNGKSVSNIVIDGELKENIENNLKLAQDLKSEGRLDAVISRAEFRVLENKRKKIKFDIASHNDIVKKGYKIKHSLQAGPMLYPSMDLVKEGFVIYENDIVKYQSVDILKKRERTAIGLKGKYLYIVLFTNAHKVDCNELRDFMVNELKVDKAMALDGGLSTAINYKNISIGSLGKYQRKVKSFLVIEK